MQQQQCFIKCLETHGDAGAGAILSVPCPCCVVGKLSQVGTNAASPGKSLSKESISQISLGPMCAEREGIPQAVGQAKKDSLLRMLHI